MKTIAMLALLSTSIWQTPAGKRALALRADLRHQGIHDELKENWQEVEKALTEGCQNFVAWPSRIECPAIRDTKACAESATVRTLWRVMPIYPSSADAWGFLPWSVRPKPVIITAGETTWGPPK